MLSLSQNEFESHLSRFVGSGPRYTSYPPVPAWKDQVSGLELKKATFVARNLALYIHLPFCGKLCHFCACNRVSDPLRREDDRYLSFLKKEIELWGEVRTPVGEMHWGGGTPTYFTPQQIWELGSF